MLKVTNLYEEASRRLNELEDLYQSIYERYQSAPPGKIHIANSAGRVQYYLRRCSLDTIENHSLESSSGVCNAQLQQKPLSARKTNSQKCNSNSEIYLRKKEHKKIIQTYLQKAYDEKLLLLMDKEIKELRSFLSNSQDYPNEIQKLHSRYELCAPCAIQTVDCETDELIRRWAETPFCGKKIAEDVPEYITRKGERVRSKSELNIANALYEHEIPYRYECPFTLNSGRIVYPDFTILDAKRRRTVYWEHRGMMDDRDYVRSAVPKLKAYAKNGVILGDNLIITEETSQAPLSTSEIERVITVFLL